MGAPLIRVTATVDTVESSPANHHGANHEHIILKDLKLETSKGLPDGTRLPERIFVAIRFGDNEGLDSEVPLQVGERIRIQGEYIDAHEAYPTPDNPGLAVLHFTHHPVGFVQAPVDGEMFS